MKGISAQLIALLGSAWLVAACSPCPAGQRSSAAASAVEAARVPVAAPPASSAPARPEGVGWMLVPSGSWVPRSVLSTDDGKLYLGADGSRWLVPASGPPRGSAFAPEGLAGALRVPSGYWFISTTGRVYAADAPLAHMVARTEAGVARTAAAGKERFVALFEDRLRFTDDGGRSWSPSDVAGNSSIHDLALLESGVGLALGERGAAFVTRDDGRTFERLKTGNLTFTRLRAVGADLRLVEAGKPPGSYRYRRFDAAPALLDERGYQSLVETGPLASWDWYSGLLGARALAGGGEPSWFLARSAENDTRIQLSLTAFGTAPQYREVASLDGCRPGPPGEGALLAACAPGDANTVIAYSEDHGKSFRTALLPSAFAGEAGQRVHRLSPTDYVISAPCGAASSAIVFSTTTGAFQPIQEQPCREHIAFWRGSQEALSLARSAAGISLHTWRDARVELLGSVLPPAVEVAEARVTMAPDGAILVVAQSRDREFFLLRSLDRGKTFTKLVLPLAKASTLSLAEGRGLLLGSEGPSSASCGTSRPCFDAFETSDQGLSWHRVEFPAFARPWVLECVPEGCTTSAGLRVGWSLPAR